MSEKGTDLNASDERVRASVALAGRRRRSRESSRKLWRVAPVTAAAGLVVAAAGHWAGWAPIVSLTVLAGSAAGVTVYAYIGRRARAVSDRVAAEIDAHAGLGGELRSARWFAGRDDRDAWVQFHVDRAAERLHAIDWKQLYPDVRARGARLVTAAIAIAAAATAIGGPLRDWARAHALVQANSLADARDTAAPDTFVIPPELQTLLEDLLDAAETGTIPSDRSAATARDVRELLDLLASIRASDALKELARAMDADASGRTDRTAQQLTSLAERARRAAAAAATPPDVREALEKLAKDLSEAAADERLATAPAQTAGLKQGPQAEATTRSGAEADVNAMSIQFSKDASAEGGATLIMMSGPRAGAGDVQPGIGPSSDSPLQQGTSTSSGLAQALRRETVEANENDQGQSVMTDARRRTEQGRATVSFTRSAAGTFDRSRASAPPAVPESRRADVRAYFTRKP